jgi:parallel beta-helix repeat protein
MILTPELNGQTIDLGGKRFVSDRRNNNPAISFAEGTKNITLCNFSFSGRGLRVHGSGHTIENFQIDAFGCGIFIESGSHNNTIRFGDIKAGAVGVYLEHGSHHNTIENNNIHDCGYWYDQANLPFRMPRFGLDKREGIAVDASTDNIIAHNTLSRNALAGITLYKNCGEYGQAKRKQGANRNIIYNNEITGSRVKIWNKAREWRDMVAWGCSCQGEWVPLWKVPKQPYSQWFNLACITTPIFIKSEPFRSPFRWRIWKVYDEAIENQIL